MTNDPKQPLDPEAPQQPDARQNQQPELDITRQPLDADGITVRDIILWNRIGRISVLLARRLDVSPEDAFDIFYQSDTCQRLHNESTGLYLMGDLYVVDDVVLELQQRQA